MTCRICGQPPRTADGRLMEGNPPRCEPGRVGCEAAKQEPPRMVNAPRQEACLQAVASGCRTSHEVAQAMGVSNGTARKVLRKLAEKGLVAHSHGSNRIAYWVPGDSCGLAAIRKEDAERAVPVRGMNTPPSMPLKRPESVRLEYAVDGIKMDHKSACIQRRRSQIAKGVGMAR